MSLTSDSVVRVATALQAVRKLMPVEPDLAFRRRCETVVEFLDAGPDDVVLDCGTGYGFYLRLVRDLTGATVVGLDPERERLTSARDRLRSHDRIRYVQGSATQLPFGDGTFSRIICSEVLEHLADDARAVAELHRVLAPGGFLVVTVPSADYPFAWDPINSILERLTGRRVHIGGERLFSGIWYGHRRLYTMANLVKLLEDTGFTVAERRPLTHYCPPFAHLVLYGLLKPLLLRGAVPRTLAQAGDRFADATPPPWHPVGLAARLLAAIDRRNDAPDLPERKRTFVALAMKGVKGV
jgi:ubiquinone/menaquinone biosynthesis C-methylase UbiE